MVFARHQPWRGSSQPADTPYLSAAQEWDRRIGAPTVQARNWRLAAFTLAVTSSILAGGLVYESSLSHIKPYYVPIDETGRPGKVELIDGVYTPSKAAIVFFLSDWVRTMFSRSHDQVVERQNIDRAFGFLRGAAANTVNEWGSVHDPFNDIEHVGRTVTVNSVLQRSDQTWQVSWTEDSTKDGQTTSLVHYTGLFQVTATGPQTEADVLKNPLGLYIDSISWSPDGGQQ